jgi:hypothetical protein
MPNNMTLEKDAIFQYIDEKLSAIETKKSKLTVINTIISAFIGFCSVGLITLLISFLINYGKNEIFKQYTPLQGQTFIVEKGILDLIEKERTFSNKPFTIPVEDVYNENSMVIKKIDRKVSSFEGLNEIAAHYRDPDLIVNDTNKYNYKVFYTKYENEKPIEALVTYDSLIKYTWKRTTKYELKLGKELIKVTKRQDKWVIDYFYMESE